MCFGNLHSCEHGWAYQAAAYVLHMDIKRTLNSTPGSSLTVITVGSPKEFQEYAQVLLLLGCILNMLKLYTV